jgi:hypothetical protein
MLSQRIAQSYLEAQLQHKLSSSTSIFNRLPWYNRAVKARTLNKSTIALAAIAIFVAGGLYLILRPQRSVAAYCRVYHQENQMLQHATGNTYSVAVFSHSSSNAKDFVSAFSALDQVAPAEIEPDVRTLKLVFQKMNSDPSQSITASLSGIGAETSVTTWTKDHCK